MVQQCSGDHHCHVTDDESYEATGDLITAMYDSAAAAAAAADDDVDDASLSYTLVITFIASHCRCKDNSLS